MEGTGFVDVGHRVLTHGLQYMGHRFGKRCSKGLAEQCRRPTIVDKLFSAGVFHPQQLIHERLGVLKLPRCWMARFSAELEATAVKLLRGLVTRCASAQGDPGPPPEGGRDCGS